MDNYTKFGLVILVILIIVVIVYFARNGISKAYSNTIGPAIQNQPSKT